MFEKEAKEYREKWKNEGYYLVSEEMEQEGLDYIIDESFKDGAEFGYNKANEWNIETPSSAVGNKDLLLRVAKDDFDVGYYHLENQKFYTNDGREVIPLAWKVIVPPERKPEVEG